MSSNNDKFLSIVNFTLANEGGYVFDPLDSGGETNFGITKRTYPDLNIRNLTRDNAIAIYKKDYWDKYNFDLINDVDICRKLFDMSVNMGYRQAARLLQRAAGVKDDGQIGEVSLKAINSSDPKQLLSKFRDNLISFYKNLVLKKATNDRFINGWIRRVYL